jgi:hypothetical protein
MRVVQLLVIRLEHWCKVATLVLLLVVVGVAAAPPVAHFFSMSGK